jgi:hypothetical protein
MFNLVVGFIKICATSIGVGFLNERFFKKHPHPPGRIVDLLNNPLFPVLTGTLINKPELVMRPMLKTSTALVSLADKTGKVLWEEENVHKKRGTMSLTEISNLFWLSIDNVVAFGIRKPKVLAFMILGTSLGYLLLEPSLNSFLNRRRLLMLERRLTQKIQEEKLLKTVSENLQSKEGPLLSDLIAEINSGKDDLTSDLAFLANKDHVSQRDIILNILKCLKK